MIPQIINLAWLGDNLLPDDYVKHINAWAELNPGFEVKCWVSSSAVAEKIKQECAAPSIHTIAIEEQQQALGNYDLIKALLNHNIRGAVDILKVDVVILGGYYFDLGIQPKKTITGNVDKKIKALCELARDPEPKRRTIGEYHIHASEPNGELYVLAQKLIRIMMGEINRRKSDFPTFYSENSFLNYLSTLRLLGSVVFAAVDALIGAGKDGKDFITRYPVSNLGIPKKSAKNQILITAEQKQQLELCDRNTLELHLRLIRVGAGIAKGVYSSDSRVTFFAREISSHQQFLSDLNKFYGTNNVSKDVRSQVDKKEYSLALRIACSTGNPALVKLFLTYRDKLPIDFNATSSNGKSALDWWSASSITVEVKTEIKKHVIDAMLLQHLTVNPKI